MTPTREVRAVFNELTIRMYQAYSHGIADAALAAGTFVAPFKRDRMTWIKPSFRWMMYRSGWAAKDAGQDRILAVDVTRAGLEWALRSSCLSDAAARLDRVAARRLMEAHPVRVQWDPERDLDFNALDHRSIQIGLCREAVDLYVDKWIVGITDITTLAHEVGAAVRDRDLDAARTLFPDERSYPLPSDIAAHLGAKEPEPLKPSPTLPDKATRDGNEEQRSDRH